jgi:uncharacterized membrane protein
MWRRFQSVMIVVFLLAFAVEGWRALTGPWFTKGHARIDCVFALYFAADLIHRRLKEETASAIAYEVLAVTAVLLVGFVIVAARLS